MKIAILTRMIDFHVYRFVS